MGLYENIKKVAALRGYTISKLEQELGFPRSSISKYNSSDPSVGKIRQIANFLDVSYSSIISGDDDNGLTASDHKDIAKSLDEMMEQLESGTDSPLMYNGQELSETSKALLRNALEYALTETKKENKVKYNPNKNKG
nr:MAG TPA: repressor protein [Caudoviricetes sp.]